MAVSSTVPHWSSWLFSADTRLFLLRLCGTVWSLVLWCSSIGLFAQNCFGYSRSFCVSICILGLVFQSLWRTSLNFEMWIAFGSMVIFTMLILLIHEHAGSSPLLMSSLISLLVVYSFHYKGLWAGCRWLTPVLLAAQEAEIRRITVWSQPRKTVFSRIPNTKGLVQWLKV
jgi:hypothetical protein